MAQAIGGRLTYERLSEILHRLHSHVNREVILYTVAQAEALRKEVMSVLPQICTLQGKVATLFQTDKEHIFEIRQRVFDAVVDGFNVFLTEKEYKYLDNYLETTSLFNQLNTDRIEARVVKACSQKAPF